MEGGRKGGEGEDMDIQLTDTTSTTLTFTHTPSLLHRVGVSSAG